MTTDTREKKFQEDFYTYLEDTGYVKRTTDNYNVSTCVDVELVLKFIKSTQYNQLKKFAQHNGGIDTPEADAKFIESLAREINNRGTIEVLRKGFKDIGRFKMFYPKPHTSLNPEAEEKFNKNIFSVVDELEYQNREFGNRLDLVIFINGIPISTIELKDTFTQGVQNAIDQYKEDRDPKEQLFKNCLVHFAVSDEKIYMTTKLAGDETRFLPFNKGIENPIVENDYKTSYLYKEILQKNQLSLLINNFIFEEDGTVIFPRFHQLDCVNYLLRDPQPGQNYLVQHSAGSGKTKTIAWLAHNLLNRNDSNDKRVYDMVIVISDRRVIDDQLQKLNKIVRDDRVLYHQPMVIGNIPDRIIKPHVLVGKDLRARRILDKIQIQHSVVGSEQICKEEYNCGQNSNGQCIFFIKVSDRQDYGDCNQEHYVISKHRCGYGIDNGDRSHQRILDPALLILKVPSETHR